MPTALQLRRGTTAQTSAFTGLSGEITFDTDKKILVVHDGATAGGINIATETYVDTAIATNVDFTGYATETYVDTAVGNVQLDLSAIDQSIIPDANEAYDLGTAEKKFRDLYLSSGTIYLGDAQISASGSALVLPPNSTTSYEVVATSTLVENSLSATEIVFNGFHDSMGENAIQINLFSLPDGPAGDIMQSWEVGTPIEWVVNGNTYTVTPSYISFEQDPSFEFDVADGQAISLGEDLGSSPYSITIETGSITTTLDATLGDGDVFLTSTGEVVTGAGGTTVSGEYGVGTKFYDRYQPLVPGKNTGKIDRLTGTIVTTTSPYAEVASTDVSMSSYTDGNVWVGDAMIEFDGSSAFGQWLVANGYFDQTSGEPSSTIPFGSSPTNITDMPIIYLWVDGSFGVMEWNFGSLNAAQQAVIDTLSANSTFYWQGVVSTFNKNLTAGVDYVMGDGTLIRGNDTSSYSISKSVGDKIYEKVGNLVDGLAPSTTDNIQVDRVHGVLTRGSVYDGEAIQWGPTINNGSLVSSGESSNFMSHYYGTTTFPWDNSMSDLINDLNDPSIEWPENWSFSENTLLNCMVSYSRDNVLNNQANVIIANNIMIGNRLAATNGTMKSHRNNIGIGQFTLSSAGTNNSYVDGNVAVGYNSLSNINRSLPASTSSSYNTAVGSSAGQYGGTSTSRNNAADYSTFVGAYTRGFFANTGTVNHNQTVIGYNAVAVGNNTVSLGNSDTTTYVYGTVQNRSDERDKADVRDTVLGLDFVNKLRPVDFKWDIREDYVVTTEEDVEVTKTREVVNRNFDSSQPVSDENPRTIMEEYTETEKQMVVTELTKDGSKKRNRYHHGLIAQEVKAIIDETGVDFGGFQDHNIEHGSDVYSIGYDEMVAPLIKAVQELSAQNAALVARIEALEAK